MRMDATARDKEVRIAAQLKAGDPACMKAVFDNYHHGLCMRAMRYLSSWEDARDVVQGVLVSFWKNWCGREFHGSMQAYLSVAVVKASLKVLRDSGKFRFVAMERQLAEVMSELDDADAEFVERLRERVAACVAALPESQRNVLAGIVFGGKAYKEVAAELGISLNTVKTHYARALRAVREQMDADGVLLPSLKKNSSPDATVLLLFFAG